MSAVSISESETIVGIEDSVLEAIIGNEVRRRFRFSSYFASIVLYFFFVSFFPCLSSVALIPVDL
jgi:hypothetical protein